jgi:hypothetical protein
VPRSSASEIAGELADMALAVGTALVGALSAPNPVPRAPGAPM